MTIKEIYKLAIDLGIKNDFRSKKEIQDFLKRKKEKYNKLPKDEKEFFDKTFFENPYPDSKIHFSKNNKKIKKVLSGIDSDVGTIMMAKEMKIDLVINHHPLGKALADLDKVMDLQIDYLEKMGVPVNIAEKLFHKRISEVARGVNPVNHYAVTDAAKLMSVNLMNVHTPADNLVANFLDKEIKKAKPKYVSDILKVLNKISEYQEATKKGFGPVLFSGNPENRCGKIAVSEITGGTEGSKDIYEALANAGIGTVVAMHQSEDHRKAAERAHINVVVAGHISSDSIGMNLFLDELEKKGIEIVPMGGLIRVSRNKK